MTTPISLFDYDLPPDRIAQHSVEPRDHSRLMVLHRDDETIEHRSFFEVVDYLQKGDVLVMNQSRVFKARLKAEGFEVFLLRPYSVAPPVMERQGEVSRWEVLLRPARRAKIGDVLTISDTALTIEEKRDDGAVIISFDCDVDSVFALCDRVGEIPIPPYVGEMPEAIEKYQTVYAKETGSVAAPTAGFHLTDRLLDELRKKGVQIEFVTLHVGLGTFRPVKTKTLEEHEMHHEFVQIDQETAARINVAKEEGRRVIAVGTTTVRALEGSGVPEEGFAGDVNLFITPGFDFQIIDGLITNFHLPKSTLLVLVSAFAGRAFVFRAYREAIDRGYRFFSFGDAMLIL